MWLLFTVELGRNCIISAFSSKAFDGHSLFGLGVKAHSK